MTDSAGNALLAAGNFAFAQGSDAIRVGLVGCGGRGRNALENIVEAAPGVEIRALGDAFKDRVDMARDLCKKFGDKNKTSDDRCFVGLDAYHRVIGSDVNYIILATPPGYRSLHLRAAVDAGKNVFAEKPVATCPTAARSVMETARLASSRNVGIVAGTQRRHQLPYVETIKRIHAGALGDIVSGQIYWMQGDIWAIPRTPDMSDMDWALRNWQYFTAFGGDHVVEQHIHNIDVMCWVMGGHPERAVAMGGKQVRTDRNRYGSVYDHFGVNFEYANGVTVHSLSRQEPGTEPWTRVTERFVGTKGVADPGGRIYGTNEYRYEGPKPNPYVQEHADLIASIRAGKPLNEGRQVAESTLTAIMARESAYSGQIVTWDQLMNSTLDLRPDKLAMKDPYPLPATPQPGTYRLV